jgi:hypothetical protein
VRVRHGRATVCGKPTASQTLASSHTHSLAPRKGYEMVLAFPVLLVGLVGVVCSLLGCVVPFSAIALAAALYCGRRFGFGVVLATWALNQLLGFTLHGYPHAASTFAWGMGIGIAGIASFTAAAALRRSVALAFVAAFFAFEAVLMIFSIQLGDWAAYAPQILAQLFITNALWFAAMYGVTRYGLNLHPAR